MPSIAELRALDARATALDGDHLPAFVRGLLARCQDDVAVIPASKEPDIVAMLDGVDIESFEQLRGLFRTQ